MQLTEMATPKRTQKNRRKHVRSHRVQVGLDNRVAKLSDDCWQEVTRDCASSAVTESDSRERNGLGVLQGLEKRFGVKIGIHGSRPIL